MLLRFRFGLTQTCLQRLAPEPSDYTSPNISKVVHSGAGNGIWLLTGLEIASATYSWA